MDLLLWKTGYTAFVLLVCVIWLRHYGARNFLWFSDIAFIGAVPAMWLESPALASVLAVAVLVPGDPVERRLRRAAAAAPAHHRDSPTTCSNPNGRRLLRGLSLFHVPLPLVLLWMVHAYGYDAEVGLVGAIVLAAIVLPWSRAVSSPERNINWTYGLGRRAHASRRRIYMALLFAGFVILVFIPTHYLLRATFPAAP